MATIFRVVVDSYDEYVANVDPRFTKWILTDSPTLVFLSVVIYILFISYIGPAWMKEKKPFDLRYIMFMYNMMRFLISIYFFVEASGILLREKSSGFCRVGSENDPGAMRIIKIAWWYLLGSIVDLLDTVFFVLRKKHDHISKTHVIHHAMLPIATWLVIRTEAGGPLIYGSLVHSTVHTVMHLYFGLSAFGPSVQKYLWWKKYLTYLNISQMILGLSCIIIVRIKNCKMSKFIVYLWSFVVIIFLVLFVLYFHNAYKGKQPSTKATSVHAVTNNCNAATDTVKPNLLFNNGQQESIKKTE